MRFFYDRLKENRGGVLGDDMGLVSPCGCILIRRSAYYIMSFGEKGTYGLNRGLKQDSALKLHLR